MRGLLLLYDIPYWIIIITIGPCRYFLPSLEKHGSSLFIYIFVKRNEERVARTCQTCECVQHERNCICTKMTACMDVCTNVKLHCVSIYVFIVFKLYLYPFVQH